MIVPRYQQKQLYMTNKDVNDEENNEDNHNEENNDEDYEIFENTPDFTTLGHKIVSTTNDRVEVLFIKLVMSRLKVIPCFFIVNSDIYSITHSLKGKVLYQ